MTLNQDSVEFLRRFDTWRTPPFSELFSCDHYKQQGLLEERSIALDRATPSGAGGFYWLQYQLTEAGKRALEESRG